MRLSLPRATLARGRAFRRVAGAAAAGAAGAVLLSPTAATAVATVSATTASPGGRTTVTAGCGSNATSATVSGTSFGGPSQIPLDVYPDGGPGAFRSTVSVPAATVPGTYQLSVTCNNGEGGTGAVVIAPVGAPRGGGGSTSLGPNGVLLATGGVLMAGSAVAGAVLIRRRTRPTAV